MGLFSQQVYDSAASSMNDCQKKAFDKLCNTNDNIFLTGGAGTGKSYVLKHFRDICNDVGEFVPVAASTGAAAILVGGQTFHRVFGIGVATDVNSAVLAALQKPAVIRRLQNIETLIIDEVSMLPDYAITAAEKVARLARGIGTPWGGIRIIAVGDFRQLPPVTKGGEARPWAFLSEAWEKSEFTPLLLKTPVRSLDPHFNDILQDARLGKHTERLSSFLKDRIVDDGFAGLMPRVYSTRDSVEHFNVMKLGEIQGEHHVFPTEYAGPEHIVALLKKEAPIPEVLILKPGALVMLRNNDPEDMWVNGSLGTVLEVSSYGVYVRLHAGADVLVERVPFLYNNEFGDVLGSATNYPMCLAWATTIHKSQGATMDAALFDLSRLWEPGQLYVALSRVKSPDGVKVLKWNPVRAFVRDPKVSEFHKKLLDTVGW